MQTIRKWISLVLLSCALPAWALDPAPDLVINGVKIETHVAEVMLYTWSDRFVFNDFKTVVLNGVTVKPHFLKKGESVFLRADDGTADTRLEELRTGKERRAILCGVKAAQIPDDVDITGAALLDLGDAVLIKLIDESQEPATDGVRLYVCQEMETKFRFPACPKQC